MIVLAANHRLTIRSAVACLLVAFACVVHAEIVIGRVVSVADGDTITILDIDRVQHKIRLTGIDAPEKKQPFGSKSKASLAELVFDKTVEVETSKRDRYGRHIGKVFFNGLDINLIQVERGMAWFYRKYQLEQSPIDRQLYESAENSARFGKKGLWNDFEPMPPWDFRQSK